MYGNGDMHCDEARRNVYVFLDGELDVEKNLAVLAHLNVCPACSAAFEAEKRLTEMVREKGDPGPAPGGLAERCREAVRREGRRTVPLRRWVAAAAAAAVLVAVLIPVLLPPPVAAGALVPRMADIHARLLRDDMAGRFAVPPFHGDDAALQSRFRDCLGGPVCLHDLQVLGRQYRAECGMVVRLDGAEGGRAAWVVYDCSAPAGVPAKLTQAVLRVPDAAGLAGGEDYAVDGRTFRRFRQGDYTVLVSQFGAEACVFLFRADDEREVRELAMAIRH